MLSIKPKDNVEGPLQDIYWAFGEYFPSYAVANLISAQLREAMAKDVNIEECLFKGDYKPILDWLHTHVHQHGMRYTTLELVKQATGEELSPDAFIRHIKKRYQMP